MPKVFNVAAIVDRWKKAMASPDAAKNYTDGINRVTESPMAKAALKSDEAASNYQRVVTSQAHKDKMTSYPLSTWKTQAISMATRLADGAKKASVKYMAFVNKFVTVWAEMRTMADAEQGAGIAGAKAKSNAALEVLMRAGKKYASEAA